MNHVRLLRRDPLAPLLATDDAALLYVVQRDLLGGSSVSPASVREAPGVLRVVAGQQPDGRWRYPGGNPEVRSRADYDQLETYRQLARLVCKYGLDRRQHTPNYSAAIPSFLSGLDMKAARRWRRPCDGCWRCARTTEGGRSPPGRLACP